MSPRPQLSEHLQFYVSAAGMSGRHSGGKLYRTIYPSQTQHPLFTLYTISTDCSGKDRLAGLEVRSSKGNLTPPPFFARSLNP